ncbi:MAG: histidine phosphatase family protein [Desulfobacterales bacterium]|nr:MAG: histidine phosphatase family protein [Desulfobacterales bacterium]
MDWDTVKNRYFVMRHGQSLANLEKIIVSSPENGISGYGLTDTGKTQAKASISGFQGLDQNTLIYSSDFKRAKETAQIVAAHLITRNGITCVPQLRERFFGEWELTGDENYPNVWYSDAQGISPPPNKVESVGAVLKRIEALIYQIESTHENQNVLLVSHGDPLQIFLTGLKGLPPQRHREIAHLETAEIRPVFTL